MQVIQELQSFERWGLPIPLSHPPRGSGGPERDKTIHINFAPSGKDVQRKPACMNIAGVYFCSLNEVKRQNVFKEGRHEYVYKIQS